MQAQCDYEEFDYLKSLYVSTNGDSWTNNTGWDIIKNNEEAPDVCVLSGLYGISLDNDDRISVINLSNNNLTGILPTEGLPSRLIEINISDNSISGIIPNGFYYSPGLININYSNNQFTENLPSIYALTIEHLDFSGNGLSGTISERFGDYTFLKTLHLGDNDNYNSQGFEGTIPEELGQLINLTSLTLQDNNLSGCFPKQLKTLCDVATSANISSGNNLSNWDTFCNTDDGACYCNNEDFLVLKGLSESTDGTKWLDTTGWNPIINNATCPDGYHISSAVGITVNELYRVDSISLRNNKLEGELPFAWRGLEYTTFINLSKNLLEGEIPTDLGSMSNLKDLRLHHNKRLTSPGLTGDIPVKSWNFDSLEVLSLSQNALTGGIPPELGEKANLRELWLEQNQLGGSIPGSLGHLKNLTVMRINQNGMSGCFPTNLLHLCGQLTNYNINGGNNNFDDTWINLCNSNSGLCSDCTEKDILWSGAISDQWDNPMNWEYGCLPQSDGSVTIAYGESAVIPSLYTDTIKSMKIYDATTQLTINTVAKLFIRNASQTTGNDEAIENYGIITNNGELQIDSSKHEAIKNYGIIENNKLLEILNSESEGFVNHKTLTNSSNILISQIDDTAIVNKDSIFNSSSGTITISNVLSEEGIENSGDSQDSAILMNYGNIIIHDIMNGDGITINSNGIIKNKGEINIMDVNGDGIELYGRLSNESLIDLSNITGVYGIDAKTFAQPSHFQNHSTGDITMDNAGANAGINIRGIGSNHGVISIISSPKDGLRIDSNYNFINNGMIEINSSNDDGLTIYDDAELNNTGIINISTPSERGLYLRTGGTYVNEPLGELMISNSADFGIFMSLNSALSNLENGKITVINTAEVPLQVETGAVLEGYHTIEIKD